LDGLGAEVRREVEEKEKKWEKRGKKGVFIIGGNLGTAGEGVSGDSRLRGERGQWNAKKKSSSIARIGRKKGRSYREAAR